MSLDLDAIEKRVNTATKGPWIRGSHDSDGNRYIGALCQDCIPPCEAPGELVATAGEADAEFIEHSRTDVPALVEEVKRLRATAARIVAEEQRLQAAIADDPTNPHLQGHLAGLQRARDITTEGSRP